MPKLRALLCVLCLGHESPTGTGTRRRVFIGKIYKKACMWTGPSKHVHTIFFAGCLIHAEEFAQGSRGQIGKCYVETGLGLIHLAITVVLFSGVPVVEPSSENTPNECFDPNV